MASDRETSSSLIDIAAVVVSPALVMLMVGSLTFFLITVLYQGAYPDRLLYTFFFFVFGAVLIARISIRFGRACAGLYAAGLGGACFLAMMAFVNYPTGLMKALGPIINLGLMALVWWSANKLTWDCTHFDDDRKASGKGVLAAAGLDEAPAARRQERTGGGEAGRAPKRTRRSDRKNRSAGWRSSRRTASSSARSRTRPGCGCCTSRWRRCRCSRWASRSSTPPTAPPAGRRSSRWRSTSAAGWACSSRRRCSGLNATWSSATPASRRSWSAAGSGWGRG